MFIYHKNNYVIILGSITSTFFVRVELVSKYNPITMAPQTLAWAKLASLPESARDVRVYSSCFLFVRTDYLRFEADPEDIEQFLADSIGLEGITFQTYSKNKMRLATSDYGLVARKDMRQANPEFTGFFENLPDDGNEYFYSIHVPPAWYKEEIRGAGRYYDLRENERGCLSELIVDDEKHIVYVFKGS